MMIKLALYLQLFLFFIKVPALNTLYAQTDKPVLDGTFLTGDLCGFWSDTRWQQEFTALKNAGMHYVVIQAVADSYPQRTTFTLFPSTLPNTEIAKGAYNKTYPDVVDACLRNAESAGIKVFIGIDFNTKWWELYANDSLWLYKQMDLDNSICDELWNNYKGKYPNAFYGWYWAYEIDNLHFKTEEQQKVLIEAMNKQLDHLLTTEEKLPFMWCPFMNSEVGEPDEYETMWKNVFAELHLTEGDIFCPQDGVGAGGLKLNEVSEWYSALKHAVDTKPGLIMWSDVETFRYYNNSFIAATIDRLVTQLKIEQPYVDNYISWEYSYYYSPFNTSSGFHNTYLDYLENSLVEDSPPTSPGNFTVKAFPGTVLLNWNTATDNIGVCGYNVYRNGKKILINQSAVKSYSIKNTKADTNALDMNIEPNKNYSYQVEAYDFAGNVSGLSSSILVSSNNYEKVSIGCPYTVSSPPSKYYPDTYHKKLTDGSISQQAYFTNPQWVGFSNIDTLDVIIDLKSEVDIFSFTTNYLQDHQPAIYLPKNINIFLSNNNNTFNYAGVMADLIPDDISLSKHIYYLTLPEPITARYVKFSTITNNKAWLFVDEYQVFGKTNTGISVTQKDDIKGYYLSNNYPNPFNPTTTINYQISAVKTLQAASQQVQLKVYDVLGREVATLVNKQQKPGHYKVKFNAYGLPSGLYFYKIQIGEYLKTRKMLLMK